MRVHKSPEPHRASGGNPKRDAPHSGTTSRRPSPGIPAVFQYEKKDTPASAPAQGRIPASRGRTAPESAARPVAPGADHLTIEVVGTVTPQERAEREPRLRAAVAEAIERVAASRNRLRATLSGSHENPDPAVLAALRASFPVFQDHAPGSQEFHRMAQHVLVVLSLIHNGLTTPGVRFALAGRPGLFDMTARNAQASGAYGWVDAPLLGVGHDQSRPELPPLGRLDGPINLFPAGLSAWSVIHEASHKFARTLDYQYTPHERELGEDSAMGNLADAFEDDPAQSEAIARQRTQQLDRRRSRPAESFVANYWGRDQLAWYAMGPRALMNADSYAQLVMTLRQE